MLNVAASAVKLGVPQNDNKENPVVDQKKKPQIASCNQNASQRSKA